MVMVIDSISEFWRCKNHMGAEQETVKMKQHML